MIFPQVAILWWDESKTDRPKYFEGPSFYYLVNGHLVLVLDRAKVCADSKDFKIQMTHYSPEGGFYAAPENLIFLGEL